MRNNAKNAKNAKNNVRDNVRDKKHNYSTVLLQQNIGLLFVYNFNNRFVVSGSSCHV